MNELLQEIINAVLPVLISAGVAYALYLGEKFRLWINIKTTKDQRELIENVVKASVNWVEQVTGNNVVADSEKKLKMALEDIQRQLAEYGIVMEDDSLITIIESFVLGLGGDK